MFADKFFSERFFGEKSFGEKVFGETIFAEKVFAENVSAKNFGSKTSSPTIFLAKNVSTQKFFAETFLGFTKKKTLIQILSKRSPTLLETTTPGAPPGAHGGSKKMIKIPTEMFIFYSLVAGGRTNRSGSLKG